MTVKQIIRAKIRKIKNGNLQSSCVRILEDEKFFIWPASLGFHHAYEGGLVLHTLEATNIAEEMASGGHIQKPNLDVILAACLWHDFLKTEEYVLADSPIEGQRSLQHGAKFFVKGVGQDSGHSHIINGAEEFRKEAEQNGVDPDLIGQVEHCILSHHGFIKEWGSPIAPNTLEALIVHQADMLSAKFGQSK